METLKKVLAIMVVVLVILIGAGGYLAVNMGHMNMASNSGAGQKQNDSTVKNQNSSLNNSKQEGQSQTNNMNAGKAQTENQQQTNNQQGNEQNQNSNGQNDSQKQNAVNGPFLIPVPQAPKTDPQVYVEQLKERLKAINEANNSIAGKSSGQSAIVQQNGSVIQPSSNNQLNLDFYKLGQNMATMDQSLNDLSKSISENQQYGALPYNPYVYPQYPGTGYYPYSPYSQYQGQYPGYQLPNQNTQNNNGTSGENSGNNGSSQSGMTNNNSMSNMNGMQMNSNGLSGLFSSGNIKTVFTIILLASVVLAIVAVIGFISSLFKRGKNTNSSENQTTNIQY